MERLGSKWESLEEREKVVVSGGTWKSIGEGKDGPEGSGERNFVTGRGIRKSGRRRDEWVNEQINTERGPSNNRRISPRTDQLGTYRSRILSRTNYRPRIIYIKILIFTFQVKMFILYISDLYNLYLGLDCLSC